MCHVLDTHRVSRKGSLCLCSGGAMRPLSVLEGEGPQGTGAHKTWVTAGALSGESLAQCDWGTGFTPTAGKISENPACPPVSSQPGISDSLTRLRKLQFTVHVVKHLHGELETRRKEWCVCARGGRAHPHNPRDPLGTGSKVHKAGTRSTQ